MAKEACIYIVEWESEYKKGKTVFFTQKQVDSFLKKHSNDFIRHTVTKDFGNGKT